MYAIENEYVDFDYEIGTKHWSPYKRLKRLIKIRYKEFKKKIELL